MIELHDLGQSGVNDTPLAIDEKYIVSLSADPVEASRTVVTLASGVWFLVSESVAEIEAMIEAK